MHRPTYVCTHISVQKIITEDNKYLYATITNYLTIAMNKSLLKQGHRDTKNHGEMIDCITHHVCQEIQGVDEDSADGVDAEVDEEVPPQGGEAAW